MEVPEFEPQVPYEAKSLYGGDLFAGQSIGKCKEERPNALKGRQAQGFRQLSGNLEGILLEHLEGSGVVGS